MKCAREEREEVRGAWRTGRYYSSTGKAGEDVSEIDDGEVTKIAAVGSMKG